MGVRNGVESRAAGFDPGAFECWDVQWGAWEEGSGVATDRGGSGLKWTWERRG